MELARKILLGLVALVFAGIAVANLVVGPAKMAEGLGLTPVGVDGLSELRAVYIGVWLATAAIFVMAIRRPALHDVTALLLGGQVVGRLLSLALDGAPGPRIVPFFIVETLGVIALIALRPRRQ